jgi:hypothetical protein
LEEDQTALGLYWFMFLGVDRVVCTMCCTHLLVLSIDAQAGLEPVVVVLAAAVGRNGANFSQCSLAWGGFPWTRSSEYCTV